MFYDSYLGLCQSVGKKPTTVAKEIGFTANAPYQWSKGKMPTADTLRKIADYFSITVDMLLGDSFQTDASRPEMALNPDTLTIEAVKGMKTFTFTVHGDSMEPLMRHGDTITVDTQCGYNDGDYIVLIVGSKGMCRRLKYRSDGVMLQALNPDYEPLYFTDEQLKNGEAMILGRATERHGKL